MRPFRHLHVRWLGLALDLLLGACLPEDARPPPTRLEVRVQSDATSGFSTIDSWQIRFDRFLLSIGNVRLDDADGAHCEPYTETPYLRLLDLTQPGPHRLATLFARGRCTLWLELSGPERETVLGTGVNASDLRFMLASGPGMDAQVASSVLYVEGTASKAERTLRFRWSIRTPLNFSVCPVLTLEAGEARTLTLNIHARGLFRDRLDVASPELRFDAYAAADADADAELTLEELRAVPAAGGAAFNSLADMLTLGLYPRLPFMGTTSTCADAVTGS